MSPVFLHADEWAEYFDAIPLTRERVLATVKLQPLQDTRGVGVAVERRLRAIRHDYDRDLLELGLDGGVGRGPALRCFIDAPRRIVVEESNHARVLLIEDACGQCTVICLRRSDSLSRSSPSPRSIEAYDHSRTAATHFVDRASWRVTCPQLRPLPRRTCRSYVRDTRRGSS